MSVSFAHFTPEEEALVTQIVARAETLFHEHHPHATFDRLAFEMDIAAVHAHTPLRLTEWLAADDFNFVHDWSGIQRHIDRETGQLEDFFVPRFARRKAPGDAVTPPALA